MLTEKWRQARAVVNMYRTVEGLNELLNIKKAELTGTEAELIEAYADRDQALARSVKLQNQVDEAHAQSRYLFQTILNVRKVTNGELVDGKVELAPLLEALDGVGQNG